MSSQCVMSSEKACYNPRLSLIEGLETKLIVRAHTQTHTHTANIFSLNIEEQYVTVSSSYSRVAHNHLQSLRVVGRKWVVTQTFVLYDRGMSRVSSQLKLTACARVRF